MRWTRVCAIVGSISSRCKPMVIDCKALSKHIRRDLRKRVGELGFTPGLAVIVVGDNPASMTYVNNKCKACDEVGFHSETLHMTSTSTTEDVISAVERFAYRDDIHGVMVQLPLPEHIDEKAVVAAIPPNKDVDGLTPTNMGKLILGMDTFAPCTPRGIMTVLTDGAYPLSGANCVIIGRSNIVGKPLAAMLTQANATVTLCHSKTENLADITQQADIIICAVGKAGFLTADMVSRGAVVIDVGINRNENGKLCGDVCFDEVAEKANAITPVPGGIGVMTVTSLLENTYKSAQQFAELRMKGETLNVQSW